MTHEEPAPARAHGKVVRKVTDLCVGTFSR